MELLRNRRSLIVMFVVPLALYPALLIAVGSIEKRRETEQTQRQAMIAVEGIANAPKLAELLNAPSSGLHATTIPSDQISADLNSGELDGEIEIPANYQNDAIAGKDSQISVHVDRSRSSTPFTEKKLTAVLDQYDRWIISQRLAAHDLSENLAQPPKREVTNIATDTQTLGTLLARMLPLLLLLTGTLYPALNATTTEREIGTLETLLVTPATRGELLIAKAAMVLLSSLATALLNMISISLVIWRELPELEKLGTGVSLDVGALALSFLAAVPTLIFFAALVLMVGLLSRNLREANAYATPVMLLPIASMLVGIYDPVTTPGLLITPVVNTTVIIKDVLTGHSSIMDFLLAFVSSCVYAGLVLSLAGRVFTNEQLVNPAWEPITLHGLGFKRKKRARKFDRLPAVDEAIALAALALLLNFYLAPSWLGHGIVALLFVLEFGACAGPAILFAVIGRYRWREVFSIRRPSIHAMAGAVFMAVGLIPIVQAIAWLQQHFNILPIDPTNQLESLLSPAMSSHPILTPIFVGLMAGIGEEILFRGPLQSAFVQRLPLKMALILGALIFAAAHVDLSGMIVRFGLGLALGWIVWYTGSIFPAILMHATYDGVGLWLDGAQQSPDGEFSLALSKTMTHFSDWIMLAAALAAVIIGWELIHFSKRRLVMRDLKLEPVSTH
jgi:ABC-type Na+ efflux pump permease subunit/membrane protease YdiL (CAAX protease family)